MRTKHRVQLTKKSDSAGLQTAYEFSDMWDRDEIEAALTEGREKQADPPMPLYFLDKVEIHPSGHCQLGCPHCYGSDLAPKKRTHLPIGNMEDSILRDIRQSEVFKQDDPLIVFAGLYGEPLLYPEICEAIGLLGQLKFRFGIYTNGLNLHPDICETIVESAKKTKNRSRPSYVSINLTASVVRGPGHWDDVIENVERICKMRSERDSPLHVNIPILIVKDCCSEPILSLLQEKLLAIGVDKVRYAFPWAPLESESIVNYQLLEKKEYRDAVAIIEKLVAKAPTIVKRRMPNIRPFDHCFVMCMSLAISPEGDVFPCPEVCSPVFKKLGLSFGSVITKKISQIWLSGEHIDAFRRFDPRTVNCVCCPIDCQFNEFAARFWPPSFINLDRRMKPICSDNGQF